MCCLVSPSSYRQYHLHPNSLPASDGAGNSTQSQHTTCTSAWCAELAQPAALGGLYPVRILPLMLTQILPQSTPLSAQDEDGRAQKTVRAEQAPPGAWAEALTRSSRTAARSIAAGVVTRLASQGASLQTPGSEGQRNGSPALPEDSSAAAGRLPEYKTLAEDDLEAALALQSEARN